MMKKLILFSLVVCLFASCKKSDTEPPTEISGSIPIGEASYFCKTDNPLNYVVNNEGKMQIQISSASWPQFFHKVSYNGGNHADINLTTYCLNVKYPKNASSNVFIKFKETSTVNCQMGTQCRGWFFEQTFGAFSSSNVATCASIPLPVYITQPDFWVSCEDYN